MLALVCVFALASCSSGGGNDTKDTSMANDTKTSTANKTYKIGICNYVDDASLNQIVENIQKQLSAIEKEKNVKFDVKYDNCNADPNVMNQIIADFIASGVDLMVGVATPVALAMQSATEDNKIPPPSPIPSPPDWSLPTMPPAQTSPERLTISTPTPL